MSIINNYPNGFNGEMPHFSIGYKSTYDSLVDKDETCFYVVYDSSTDKHYLYLGDKPLASAANADITIDSSLDAASTNPVENRIITSNINKAVEVIKDDGNIGTYIPGKFYYKEGSTISDDGAPSLKFYINALESIDLSKNLEVVSTYSSEGTDAINGKGVAAALATLKFIDDDKEPVTYAAGTLYRIFDKNDKSYSLIYSPKGDKATNINFSKLAPMDHADPNDTYGVASDINYGHAKSGISYDDNSEALKDSYAESNKDKDLVGSTVGSFARVDHKHPYPSFIKVVEKSPDTDKLTIIRQLLGGDEYDFIQPGTDSSFLTEDNNKIVPANVRLNRIEESYISSSKTDAQSIVSDLTVSGNLNVAKDKSLTVTTIEAPKENEKFTMIDVNGGVSISEELEVTGDLTTTGAITATDQTITAGSLVLSSDLKAEGDISLGTDGKGLTIINGDSDAQSSLTTEYSFFAPSASITGDISAGSFSGPLDGDITSEDADFTNKIITKGFEISVDNTSSTNFKLVNDLNLNNCSIFNGGSADFSGLTTSTFNIGSVAIATDNRESTNTSDTSTIRLTVGGNNILTEYDLNESDGLIYTWISNENYATKGQLDSLSQRIVDDKWDKDDLTKIPTENVVKSYVDGMLDSSISDNSTTTAATPAAVKSYVDGMLDSSISDNSTTTAATPAAVKSYVDGILDSDIATGSTAKAATSAAVKSYVESYIESYVDGILDSSISSDSTDETAATPNAVKTYVESMITVSDTQPTVGRLWINTSLGNGVLYYYTGTEWKPVSSVWS